MTNLPTHIHPEALLEAGAAVDWYVERSSQAAERFIVELENLLLRIADAPGQFPRTGLGVRRAMLRKFPYFIVFRETDARIEIIAVAHAKRRPGYWRSRI